MTSWLKATIYPSAAHLLPQTILRDHPLQGDAILGHPTFHLDLNLKEKKSNMSISREMTRSQRWMPSPQPKVPASHYHQMFHLLLSWEVLSNALVDEKFARSSKTIGRTT